MHVPLRLKLSLMTSFLLMATIGTVSLLVLQNTRGAIESEARSRGRYMAENLARDARKATLLEDDIGLESLLVSVAGEPGVVAARLLNKDGSLLVSSRPGDAPEHERLADQQWVQTTEGTDHLTIARPSAASSSPRASCC